MLRRITLTLLIVLIAAAILAASLHVYYARTEGNGQLVWNQSEAYLFVQLNDYGYRMSYLGLLHEALKEIFPFGVPKPTDQHFSVTVLRITTTSVERYATDDLKISSIEPFDGALYSGNLLRGGTLMKWTGAQFERASPEESTNYYRDAAGLPSGPNFDDVDGWSKRTAAGEVQRESPTDYRESDAKVTVTVSGEEMTFVMNSGYISHQAYVDLLRMGKATERIWDLDERPHRVSRTQYNRIFGK